jgi:hypothetical protein
MAEREGSEFDEIHDIDDTEGLWVSAPGVKIAHLKLVYYDQI